ncbi:pyrroline-5-carboxylate reductase (plasmid) [Allorhizobium ampelinum S4]|uniref:Pyrroline-5-carboxylate reductase n=3 Tax=Rhizobium/Agrobacterium group TaxID=227290 RepID=B9K3S7_ALLAM|nr:pyrroline-5-carboxylate reductase [Allorhizobium ampelinum S4]
MPGFRGSGLSPQDPTARTAMASKKSAREGLGRDMNIILVGAGNMGFSMLQKWLADMEHRFYVVEPVGALRKRALDAGADAFATAEDLPGVFEADVVVVATKPQAVPEAVAKYAPYISKEGLFISVAAGVDIKTMVAKAGRQFAIVRCMPNTAAAIGEGMIVCCPSVQTTLSQRDLTGQLMSAIGKVAFVNDEIHMDAVTAVSGSGPAYLFHFIEALAKAGETAGLDPELAMTLAKQTVLGAARLASESDEPPTTLREQVTSPNGTTAAALSILMDLEDGLTSLVTKAVAAAKARSIELGR